MSREVEDLNRRLLRARDAMDRAYEPTEHFYGTDMGVRDPFGNAIRILQPAKAAHEAKV